MVSTRQIRGRLRGPGRANRVNLNLDGISDLPDEILLEVIKDTDDESLFRLSMTSKRFNSFALPILFQRYGLVPWHGIYLVLYRFPKFILTALRTALFLHSCPALYICGFSSEPKRLNQEMLNVLFLVKQWSGLYSLTLIFDYMWVRASIDVSEWKQTFIALLEITSTNCCGFDVVGQGQFYDSSDRGMAMKPQSVANRSSFGGGPLKAVTPTAPCISILSSFSLHSSLLLMPQFYPKTLSLLSNSSATISCISIKCLTSAEMMSKLLQDLTFPSLTTFIFEPTLSGASLSFKDFVAFLCRHQTVKILEIYYVFNAGKKSISRPSFPNLNRLHAYPRSITWFLASVHKLPALTDIGILFEDLTSADSWEISAAISRVQRDIHISFIISCLSPFQRWVNTCITARNSRKHVIRSLLNVKNLTLTTIPALEEDLRIILVSWFALFPSLRSVNIVGIILGVDWKNPQNDFFKLVASTCPDLQAIGQYSQYFQLHTLRN